jgi:hypothetical protein
MSTVQTTISREVLRGGFGSRGHPGPPHLFLTRFAPPYFHS